jgi:hypothetical protein
VLFRMASDNYLITHYYMVQACLPLDRKFKEQ